MSCESYKLQRVVGDIPHKRCWSLMLWVVAVLLFFVSFFATTPAFAVAKVCASTWNQTDVPGNACGNANLCVGYADGTVIFPSGTTAPSGGNAWNSINAYPIPISDLSMNTYDCNADFVDDSRAVFSLAPLQPVSSTTGGPNPYGAGPFYGTSVVMPYRPDMVRIGDAGSEPKSTMSNMGLSWQDPTLVIVQSGDAPMGVSKGENCHTPFCSMISPRYPDIVITEPFRVRFTDPILFLPTGEAMMVPIGTQVLRPNPGTTWPDPGMDGDSADTRGCTTPPCTGVPNYGVRDGIDGNPDTVGDECPSNAWPVQPRCQTATGTVINISQQMGSVPTDQDTLADVDSDGIPCVYDPDEPCPVTFIDKDGDGIPCSVDLSGDLCPYKPYPTFQLKVGDIVVPPMVDSTTAGSIPVGQTVDADFDGVTCVTDSTLNGNGVDEGPCPTIYITQQQGIDADGDGVDCEYDTNLNGNMVDEGPCPLIDADGDGIPCTLDSNDKNKSITSAGHSCSLAMVATGGLPYNSLVNGVLRSFGEDWDGDGISCDTDLYDKEAGINIAGGNSCIAGVQYLAGGVEVPWNMPEIRYLQQPWSGSSTVSGGGCYNSATGETICPGGATPVTATGGPSIMDWLTGGGFGGIFDPANKTGCDVAGAKRAVLDILLGNTDFSSYLQSCVESAVDAGIADLLNYDGGENFRKNTIKPWYNGVTGFQAAIKDMTEQINVAIVDQSRAIGSFIDAVNQVKTQNIIQRKEKEAIERLKPSENACTMATITSGVQKSLQTGRVIKDAMNVQAAARALNLPGSGTENGPDAYANIRWRNYCTIFADATDNAGYNGCGGATGAIPGADINVERFLFRDTIDMTNPNERVAADTILTNLVDFKPLPPLPANEDTEVLRKMKITRDHYAALKQPLINVVAGIIGRRVGIPEVELELGLGQAVKDIRVQAGIPLAETTTSPSYNEMMLARTKEYFFNVDKILKTGADIGEVRQELVVNESLISMLLYDIRELEEQLNSVLMVQASIKLNGEENAKTSNNLIYSPKPR